MLRHCLAAATVTALLCALAAAQGAKGGKHAVVVGVNEYARDLSELNYAENDADEMARELMRQGFAVTLLTTKRGKVDAARMPTAANIRKAIEGLTQGRGRADTVIVCLAGHGVQLEVDDPEGREASRTYAYFCPHDFSTSGIRFETGNAPKLVSLNWVFGQFEASDAGRKIVLVDACRNMGKAKAAGRYINAKKVTVPDGVCAMFSCSTGQVAYEIAGLGGKGHGAFFHFVLEGLRGKARNVEGEVTWGSLTEFVAKSVEKKVLAAVGKRQTPHQVTNVVGATPVLVPPGAAAAPGRAEKWVQLFDGKSLKGWKTHPDQPGGWAVEKGLLTGRSTAEHHLFSEAGDYEDFRLRVEARVNKLGNSGVYFRSTSDVSRLGRYPTGYEAQILHSHPHPTAALTGSLFGLAAVTKRLVEPDEWFTLEVIAQGQRIVIKVNGKVTTDYTDRAATYEKGHIALQALSEGSPPQHTVVQFRKIEVMRLPGR